jgi:DNA uptake protein ComE-like DNA-binding protein
MLKPYQFSKLHYPGLIILICIIFGLQVYIYYNNNQSKDLPIKISNEEKSWLSMQDEIDSLADVSQKNSKKIYPFNPNFITDYKGYKLGMTLDQIDKLLAFRKNNQYVNSAKEFQNLTGVSNEWIKKYSPYFKFPDWIANKKSPNFSSGNFSTDYANEKPTNVNYVVQDINTASQEQLEKVFMVGEKTASKIIADREKLGAYVSMEQLNFIWNITPEAITDLNKKFNVLSKPTLIKININELPTKELAKFPYFNYNIAKNIVTYRSMHGDFKNSEQLTQVKDFPTEKIKFLQNYIIF